MVHDLMVQLPTYITAVKDAMWGLPFLCAVVTTAIAATVMLNFVQFTGFFRSFREVFGGKSDGKGEINSLQAFLKVLSTGLGNGALAGVAMAVGKGGPGAVFWIFVLGFLGMVLRFAEVFLTSMYSGDTVQKGRALGGPFVYLKSVPGKYFLPTLYAVVCLGYGLTSGCASQCNSIGVTILNMTSQSSSTLLQSITPWHIALALTSFILFTLVGGARRIAKVNGVIVPLKVGLFFAMALGVFIYHWSALPAAFALIFKCAMTPQACMGGVFGYSVQQLIALSLNRAINASESGLGTASIVYGATGSSSTYANGLSAMLSSFVSVQLVCVMVGLSIVVSGVLGSGAQGVALTAAAFQTVFGSLGGWATAFLSMIFGMGVFVAYGFICRQCWFFLTNDRFEHVFTLLFCAVSFWGTVSNLDVVWDLVDIMTGACFAINLFALLWNLPRIRAAVLVAQRKG